ncbi:MAG TPA: hypothetical protein VNE19_08005 [Methylomirabilota bacterium]|nr:hypothetical protein [Methylomirabilota bacterium]
MTVLRATFAALGGYFFSEALVLVALTPVRYSLPRFGDVYYDPLVTTLGVITAVGLFVAAAIAYSRGGFPAFSIVAILAVLVAATVLLPFVAAGPAAWTLPSDLHGLTPAAAIALSLLPALPALVLGLVVGARVIGRRASRIAALEAAGAYYVTGVAMSLPIPQLDLRLTLPFSATYLPEVWHAAVTATLAIAAGLVLDPRRPLKETAAVAGVIGLAGAAPAELSAVIGIPGGYWPVSLLVVPAATAAIAMTVVIARRAVVARNWSASVRALPPVVTALGGAAAMLLAIGAWSVLATMPNSSDRNGPVDSYARTGDERKIVACVVSGRGEEVLGSTAREEQNTVRVTVRLRQPPSWYVHDLVGISLPVVIPLRDPLGSRTVIDEWSGGPVQEVVRTERTGFGFGC